jgi:hypothetical protein
MNSFIVSESMPIDQKCHNIDGQDPVVHRHSGATRIGLGSISHRQKSAPVFLLLKGLNTRNGYTPKTIKVLKVVVLSSADKHKEKW